MTSPDENQAHFGKLLCPVPLNAYPQVVLAHGGGGKLTADLIEHIFLPAFKNDYLAKLSDSVVFNVAAGRMAFSTDSFVVQPLFFPGGSIGDLAVNGTVNDLAMNGARPLFMSVGFILEEGFPLDKLKRIANDMGAAAMRAGVSIVTGDTKVVERGHGDGCYINTSGIGLIPPGVNLAASQVQPGDAVLVSGTLGDHGMAIMSVRAGLEFESTIQSDTAPLHELVAQMLITCPAIRLLRDPTRGGLATSLNEIAESSNVGIVIEEKHIPISPVVQSACEILGLDPLLVANEGKLIAIVPAESADELQRVMRAHPLGCHAVRIGTIVADHPQLVVARTAIGASRVIIAPNGEQLPRIC